MNTGSKPTMALLGLSLCMLLSSLGTSIANVALPTLAEVFSASFQGVQWVVLAYLLAITTRINRALGRGIAEAPEQWFWQSRRFRHRPPGEVPGPDGLPPLAGTPPTAGPTRP